MTMLNKRAYAIPNTTKSDFILLNGEELVDEIVELTSTDEVLKFEITRSNAEVIFNKP